MVRASSDRAFALAALLLAAASLVRAGITLPDRRTGIIGGKPAVMFWPADARGPVAPAGCEAVLVPFTSLGTELRRPCGEWFLPDRGDYKTWIETADGISASPSVLRYRGTPAAEGLLGVTEVVPAGEVAIRQPVNGSRSLRIVSLTSHRNGSHVMPLFDRRIAASRVEPRKVPAGAVLAALFDDVTGDALAVARPLRVDAGKLTYAAPRPPAEGTDVVVVLDRPQPRGAVTDDVITLHLDVGDTRHAPDAIADAADRVIAVWYGVTGRSATVAVDSESIRLEPRVVRLVPRQVATLRGALAPLPAVKVTVRSSLPVAGWKLEARRLTGDVVRTRQAVEGENTIAAAPAEELRIALVSPDFEMTERVDLRSGRDAAVRFDVQPITVRGVVRRGREPVNARITFQPGAGKAIEAGAGDDGAYSATLWKPAIYKTAVTLPGREPLRGAAEIYADRTLDFDLPSNAYVIDVRSAVGETAVAGARVFAVTQPSAQNVAGTTDEHGRFAMPPLAGAHATLRVDAAGFARAEQDFDVTDGEHAIAVRLRPLDEVTSITFHLPDGAPAYGARVVLLSGANHDVEEWSGVADAAGVLDVPHPAAAVAVAMHPLAAGTLFDATQADVTLQRRAPRLDVRIDGSGATLDVALWIGAHRFIGPGVVYLTGGNPAIGATGVWSAPAIAAAPIRLLAFARTSEAAVRAGAFDTLAVAVPFPWPAQLVLQPAR